MQRVAKKYAPTPTHIIPTINNNAPNITASHYMAHIGSKYYGGVHVPVTCTSVVCSCGWVSGGRAGGGWRTGGIFTRSEAYTHRK